MAVAAASLALAFLRLPAVRGAVRFDGPLQEAAPVYPRALALYREGRFDDAARLLEAALERDGAAVGLYALLGWVRLGQSDAEAALAAFERALESDPDAAEAWAGRGYAAHRLGRSGLAEASLRRALELDEANADAWKGLAFVLRARGATAEALEAARRALALRPEDEESRGLAEQLGRERRVREERRPRSVAEGRGPLRLTFRAGAGRFERLAAEGSWRPFYLRGVNVGTAVPGRFPGEFPDDPVLYRQWLDGIGELGANAVRVYTLHPPSFYRALWEHNRERPEQKLWLIQGIWCELPPGSDFGDPAYLAEVRAEVRRVVDAVYGNLELPPRPGHAHGIYEADLGEDLFGFLFGREWEPLPVEAFNRAHPGEHTYAGRYVHAARVPAFEAWLAASLDFLASYETERYRLQHPLAFVTWPTLDPLHHPTESTIEEEFRIRGEPLPPQRATMAWDEDRASVDPTRLRATAAFPAGLFAAYHVYPYYPDFMNLDPDYAKVRDDEGTNRYLGYLQALRAHHGDQPVLVAEFGVPTSRGIAHFHPEGWHHGGHTEQAQGQILVRMARTIERAGMAGAVVFSWIDEWFKRNWMVQHRESPPWRNPLWLNVMDPEQQFGLVAARPGRDGPRAILDGSAEEWTGVAPLMQARAGPLRQLKVGSDEAYLYLALEADPAAASSTVHEIWVGVDTHAPELGDHRFPPPAEARTPLGLEFLLRFGGKGESRILVDDSYFFQEQAAGRPCRSRSNENGRFVEILEVANRERYTRAGEYIPPRDYNASRLRFGSTRRDHPDFDSLADWYRSPDGRWLEARIPWGLLNVADPSSRQVIHETEATDGPVETTATEGFRFHVLWLERGEGGWRIRGALPDRAEPELRDFPLYLWAAWEQPEYHFERKASYFILQRAWRQAAAR